MDEEERVNTIHQIAALAKEAKMIEPIDWSQLTLTEDEAYLMMASNVIEQLETVPEEQRGIVSMSTMAKLLVENFVLNIKLNGLRGSKNSGEV
jgi:hypothetical protein